MNFMVKTIVPLLLAISISMSIGSCRDVEEQPPRDCSAYGTPSSPVTIDNSLGSWKFAVGSYWVYQNDFTGVEDSVSLVNAVTEIDEFVNEPSDPNQQNCDAYFEQHRMYATGDAIQLTTYLYDESYSFTWVSIPPDHAVELGPEPTTPEMTFGNRTFNDVYCVTPWAAIDVCIAEGIGLVHWDNYSTGSTSSFEIENGSWTLVRYHIEY
jgi:hypothetical protein